MTEKELNTILYDKDRFYKEDGNPIRAYTYQLFSIADDLGMRVIRHTFIVTRHKLKNNYELLTELALVLKLKQSCWSGRNEYYAKAYRKMYSSTKLQCKKICTEEQWDYFNGVMNQVFCR